MRAAWWLMAALALWTLPAAAQISGGSPGNTLSAPTNQLRGTASATAATATTIIAAQGAALKIYVTNLQCFRNDSGTTMLYVTIDDSVSTTVALPSGGGVSLVLLTPLQVALNTALTFTASAATTTIFCSAQGYSGT